MTPTDHTQADRLLDRFEGQPTKSMRRPSADLDRDSDWEGTVDTMSRIARLAYVNCWCIGEHEPEALWRIYAPDVESGLCIQSTYQSLVQELPASDFIGVVNYIDYSTDCFKMQRASIAKCDRVDGA